MTSPPQPPAEPPAPDPAPPAPPPAPAPAPPAPPPPAEPPKPGPPQRTAEELQQALDRERADREKVQRELDKLRRAGQSEQEQAIEAARDEGRAEAVRAGGLKLAAAEFRAAAVGKLANPAALLDRLDLTGVVNDKGEVDTAAVAKLVEDLVTAAAPAGNGQQPRPGQIPPGPRDPAGEPDFFRQVMPRQR